MFIVIKYLITAALVVLISELAKRSDKMGALVASLPLVTILTLIWLHAEGQSAEKLNAHAVYTFWYVLPSLPIFLLFPWLHQTLGFFGALLACAAITALLFLGLAWLVKPFGLTLLP